MRGWIDSWDDWQWEVESLHDAGDRVVAIMRQSGRARSTGVRVDMRFAQVYTRLPAGRIGLWEGLCWLGGSVAQRLERSTHNGEVGGSIPPGAMARK